VRKKWGVQRGNGWGVHALGRVHALAVSAFLFSDGNLAVDLVLLQSVNQNLRKGFSSEKRIREGAQRTVSGEPLLQGV
jgi:hypothetical protein